MRSTFQQQGGSRLRSSWAATLLALLIGLAGDVGTALAQSQQTIPLSRGWNLVSLQVGDPAGIPVAQLGAGLDRPSNLTSLWTYDPATREFRSSLPGKPEYPSDLTVVRPGQGFWVQVEGDSVLTVEGPEWTGGFSVVPGWNLIGFPGLTVDDSGGFPWTRCWVRNRTGSLRSGLSNRALRCPAGSGTWGVTSRPGPSCRSCVRWFPDAGTGCTRRRHWTSRTNPSCCCPPTWMLPTRRMRSARRSCFSRAVFPE